MATLLHVKDSQLASVVEDTTRLKLLSDELAKRKPRRSAAKIGKKNQTKQRTLATKTKKWRK